MTGSGSSSRIHTRVLHQRLAVGVPEAVNAKQQITGNKIHNTPGLPADSASSFTLT